MTNAMRDLTPEENEALATDMERIQSVSSLRDRAAEIERVKRELVELPTSYYFKAESTITDRYTMLTMSRFVRDIQILEGRQSDPMVILHRYMNQIIRNGLALTSLKAEACLMTREAAQKQAGEVIRLPAGQMAEGSA